MMRRLEKKINGFPSGVWWTGGTGEMAFQRITHSVRRGGRQYIMMTTDRWSHTTSTQSHSASGSISCWTSPSVTVQFCPSRSSSRVKSHFLPSTNTSPVAVPLFESGISSWTAPATTARWIFDHLSAQHRHQLPTRSSSVSSHTLTPPSPFSQSLKQSGGGGDTVRRPEEFTTRWLHCTLGRQAVPVSVCVPPAASWLEYKWLFSTTDPPRHRLRNAGTARSTPIIGRPRRSGRPSPAARGWTVGCEAVHDRVVWGVSWWLGHPAAGTGTNLQMCAVSRLLLLDTIAGATAVGSEFCCARLSGALLKRLFRPSRDAQQCTLPGTCCAVPCIRLLMLGCTHPR